MAHHVFISYSNADKLIADRVCHALEEKGLRCWIAPRDIPFG
ncbi:MAG: toll/interleukin-1 receptor domain-containing protein, partial [Caulobacteraceae bacterium]